MYIKLADEVGQFCVAWDDGETIRRKILRSLVINPDPAGVTIDFSGVETTACFVNRIIADLFMVFDSIEELTSHIFYIGGDDYISMLVDRCLEGGHRYHTDPVYRRAVDEQTQRMCEGDYD